MKPVFADTSFFIALLSERDQYHQIALKLLGERRWRSVVTTSWIFNELADGARSRAERERTVVYIERFRRQPGMLLVEPEKDLFWRGFELYRRRLDKEWSLTDCISMVVMEEHAICETLSTDRHFEQAGFTILMP